MGVGPVDKHIWERLVTQSRAGSVNPKCLQYHDEERGQLFSVSQTCLTWNPSFMQSSWDWVPQNTFWEHPPQMYAFPSASCQLALPK